MPLLKEVVFGMVARKELSAAQALSLVQRLGAAWQPASSQSATTESTRPWPPVAVIGLAGRFPGAPNPQSFWTLLHEGHSSIGEAPPERWDVKRLYHPDPRQPGKTYCKWGGFLDGIADLDALFFNIPPREAEVMDPQQRLFLESAWLALEDAGYGDQALNNRRCGVFVGVGAGDFIHRLSAAGLEPDGSAFMGNSNAILSARIAYLLNLKGPCLAVDTACSSSLVAIHLACESLAQGTSELALAGGVCVLNTPNFYLAASKTGMLSPSGQCRAFDQDADGFVPGEAVGTLVLKPLDAALRDSDHIYGVIEGSATNQDGKTNGITAPSAPSQTALEQEVYRRFAIDPASIGYVEAHGTGTRLGDPIEVEALTRAFREFTSERQFCALGSVKTNVGHTMSAAGVVSVIKVLLALQHRQLPPSLHFTQENEAIGFADTPFFVNTAVRSWPLRPGYDRRRAAVSSFGFSGTNVHLVIGEAPLLSSPPVGKGPSERGKTSRWHLFTLSARTESALLQRVVDLEQWLREQSVALEIGDLALTLNAGRCHFEKRLALVAVDRDELLAQLAQWRQEGCVREIQRGDDPERNRLFKLAQEYVQGHTPDWSALYPPGSQCRLSLPGYPFERRCFLPGEHTRPRHNEGLHPLLDSVAPGEGTVRFSSQLTADLPFLRDHRVGGEAILPGVCYLEMACAAVRAWRPETTVRGLAKIAFTRLLRVTNEPVTVLLNLEKQGERLGFTVQSGLESALPHCRGELRVGDTTDVTTPRLDLASVRRRATRQLDRTALYALFERASVACGPYCQGVTELWLSETEALAELRLPSGEVAALPYYTLHPTLLDGAFQTAMAWLAVQPGAADQVLVPFAVAEIEILGSLGPGAFAYVQCRDVANARFDIALLDEEGQLQVRLLDFQAVPLNPSERSSHPLSRKEEKIVEAPEESSHPFLAEEGNIDVIPCYRPVWREESLPTTVSTVPEGTALIVHPREDSALGERLARELAPRITLRVVIGKVYQSLAPGVFEIDRRQSDDWQKLCATLKPVAAVYFCAAAPEPPADPFDLTTVGQATQCSSLSLLRLAQALRQCGRAQPGMTLTVVTHDAQAVVEDDAVQPLGSDLSGLTQTLSRECREWRVSLVDFRRRDWRSTTPPNRFITAICNKPGAEPGLAVAWRNGVRYCRFLEPVMVLEPVQPPFREQGVYVLAGGAGGLGLTVARHLTATYHARVMLLGRSDLDTQRQRYLVEMANAGGEVIYQPCDITEPATVQAVLADVRHRWGAVHGVIQAAMVLRDRALDHLDEDSFQAVLAPKVQGSVALALACIGQPLDFLAFFSSANAFVGNVGQGNYAAASTFQDAFAHFLRQRGEWSVYLINWGFWGEVGAVADPFHIRQAARLGIGAIRREEGIAILERALASEDHQLLPMKAAPATLTRLGLRCYEPLPLTDGDAGFAALAEVLQRATTDDPETDAIAAAFTQVETQGRAKLARSWREQGWLVPGQRFTIETLAQQLQLAPVYTQLLDALLDLLTDDDWLIRDGQEWVGGKRLATVTDFCTAALTELSAVSPWTTPFVRVLDHCLQEYPRLLRGELSATEVLFGPDTLPLVQALYCDNPIVARYNRLCAEVIAAQVANCLQRQDHCRVLEIGAGTGGTSATVLAALAPHGERVDYLYSDLSSGLVQQARERFGATYPLARFLTLDIERDPAEQGIEPGSCDIVLAANVLHATTRIHRTLRHVRQTLRPGGLLVLNEAIRRQDFATLTFGLTEGWWRFEDGEYRLPYSPLLNEAGWRRALLTNGFQGLASATTNRDAQTVLLAQADHRKAAKLVKPPQSFAPPLLVQKPMPPGSEDSRERSDDLTVWIEQKVRRALAQALNLAPSEIDHRRRFADYGVDSILGVDLIARLNGELGLELRATLLFDYACVADLSTHLAVAHGAELAARRMAAVATEPVTISDAGVLFGALTSSLSPIRGKRSHVPLNPSPSPTRGEGSIVQESIDRIAIVGMAGRFPGAANLDAFWEDMQAGHCRVTEVPLERWDASTYYDPDPSQPGKSPCKWGGFLDGIANFDPLFFQLSGAEAEFTDPQQRLFMEEAWNALEHAGYSDRWLNQRRAGVFVGVGAGDYTHKMIAAGLEASPYAFMGNGAAVLAGRIAYLLNLRGPALAVDTACSSSLVALHLACQSLRAGECELALAGGVFVATTPGFHALTGRLGMLSPSGQCRAFDQGANGFVPGEGVGVVALRPLEAALRDGDTIHGVIVASGSNQDGRSNGIAAPSALAQRELLETVYEHGGIDPATIGYVEAHGTGTKLGDPIEFEALNGAFRRFTDQCGFCALGSVKANIGHAGPAAGIAGLLKVLLMLKHRQLPPLLHFTKPNPHIALTDSPFFINRELQPWPATKGQPRRAAVSSFGLSGTNAHIVVEEPPMPIVVSAETGERHLLAISAHVPTSLQARLTQLQDWLAGEGASASLADIAYTLSTGRTHFTGPRAALLVTDHTDAIAKLQALREHDHAPDSWLNASASPVPDAAARAGWQREWRELMAQPRSDTVLARIAAAYVQQHDLDWNDLYPDPHHRLPLPTYPFSRARYWLPESEHVVPAVAIPLKEHDKQVLDIPIVHAFRSAWQPVTVAAHLPLPAPILVVGGVEATVTMLRQRVNIEGGVLHGVTHSLPFDPLLQQLRTDGRLPAAIVVLPNPTRHAERANEPELVRFRRSLEENLQPLLVLAGTLVREGADTPIRVISVHDDDTECGEAFGAAAGGFDRSLRSLSANLCWTALRLSWRDADPVEAILSELRATSVAEEVWWRQGQRYEHERVPVTAPAMPTVSPWRRDGVYWITGGCGALGLLLARHLVETQDAQVIVSGRQAPSGAAKTALTALGDRVWFLPADVANPLHIHHAYQQIHQRYGRLHGLIHAAGVLTTEPVHRKTAADFEAVLAPKVLGALLLDAVTRDEPLDCFLLFSSLAAAVGDFGQCDYAVANRFLDGFAAWRTRQVAQGQRHGRTLAIDWPLWEQGGLQQASPTANGHTVLVRQSALPTDAGLKTLERWLASEESCITLAVDEATVALLQTGERNPAKSESGHNTSYSSPVGEEALIQEVAEQVAAVVKLPPAQLDPQAGLASFGLDSLNMKRLAEQLSAHYQLPLNPTVLFEHNSIAALANYLATRIPQKIEPLRCSAPPLLVQGAEPGEAAFPQKRQQNESTFPRPENRDAIAIIGIAGRFPQSPDLEAFWQHLVAGDDLISEVPRERWDWRAWQSEHLADFERSISRWGGFMADIDRFDAALFGISPREAVFMDPQHRLFLETVWATLENAGYRPGVLAGRDVGVFVGCQLHEYLGLIGDAGEAKAQAVLGNTPTMLANRVSFLLDWHGPSQTIDTACSSALVAVHRAVRALRDGDCELAIAGGVHLLLAPETYVLASQMGMLSPDGRCKTFDQSANGYVKGEGVGAVLLKPLHKAEADGDYIHAVIRASAENHGGRAHFLTAPNPEAQARLLVAAYTQANIAPDTVSYIEAHGTGTELGDPIEVEALNRAFQERAAQCRQALPTAYCGLGSVKSSIGHLEPAAGIAGLLKVVLALHHRQLPATLHVQQVNPYLNLDGSPFRLITQIQDWLPLNDTHGQPLPRRAGVSSFGFGGSNAHVVLEEYAESTIDETQPLPPAILPLSARSEKALRVLAERLMADLRQNTDFLNGRWPDLLFTLQTGREAWPERLAFVADSPEQWLSRLERWLNGEPDAAGTFRGRASTPVAELTLFDSSDELHAFARAELAKGRWDKIARLWAAGAALDWAQLGSSGRRLPLPGVPFADTRYWFNHPRRADAVSTPSLNPSPMKREELSSQFPSPLSKKEGRETPEWFDPTQLRTKLRTLLADALYLPEDAIDDETSFVEMGLDSILAVELVNRLNKELGSDFKATRLYDHGNINALAKYLAEHWPMTDSSPPTSLPQEERRDVACLSSTLPASRLLQDPLPPSEGELEQGVETSVDEASIRATLKTLLADALYLEPEQIDEDANFTELGLDSILAVELVKKLTALFPVELKATRLYDHPTIRDLAAWLSNCAPLEPGAEPMKAATPTPEPNSPIASLLPVLIREQDEHDRATAAILGQLRLLLARLLYLDPTTLDDDLELLELGLDTVSAGQLSRLIAGTLGVELPAPRLLGYPGLAALAADIVNLSNADAPASAPTPAAAPLPEYRPTLTSTSLSGEEGRHRIAIIGMAGQFPSAPNLDAFWNNLAQGVDAIREIPPERWDLADCYDPTGQRPNSTYCRHGGFLEDVDRFDPLFFNIAPQEAEVMDPQQRLFLEEAWKALENAGYSDRILANSRCAIYVGAGQGDYFMHSLGNDSLPTAQFGMGSVNSILAARLAYWLNLKGAAVALDTACSSSLVAVHLACRALQDGDCDLALAGGVSLMTTPQMHILTSQSQMLSPGGRCKAFANDADGFVPGEGVGVVVLKPLERALADRDSIHGVIIGSGLNQDGHTNGITAPSVQAQSELQQSVYQRYQIDPATISYVEAHGTGTKLGDPIEIEALTESFQEYTTRRQFCAIGSVKTNIGHALPAAGIAGLLKVLLALGHRQLPPSLHCHQENEHIDFIHSPFRVNRELRDWLPILPDTPRCAAINSFGFSGTNAHLVIEEAPLVPSTVSWSPPALPFTLSAKSKAALRQRVADLSIWLEQAGETVSLPDVSYTLNIGRSHFRQRLAWVAATLAELRSRIATLSVDDTPPVNPGEAMVSAALTELQNTPDRIVRTPERQRVLLETLTVAYQAGQNVDWRELYPDGACHRLALPVYPFQGKRYWVKTTPAATAHTPQPSSLSQEEGKFWNDAQPGLLDSRVSVRLNAADPLLDNHRVRGQAWLPAAGYLSLAANAAAMLIPQHSLTSLRNIALAAPFTIADDTSRELHLRLTAGDGRVRVSMTSMDGPNEKNHVSGYLDFAPTPILSTLDVQAITAACPECMGSEAIYQRFAALGIEYGPTYRLLQTVQVGADQVLGTLATPLADSRFKAWLPGLLDAALQTLIGFVPEKQADNDRLMLPFAIDAVWLDAPLANIRYVHARCRPTAGDTLSFDLSLSDGEGRVCLRFENFQVRGVTNPTPFTLAYLAMRWQPTTWPEPAPAFAGHTLILRAEQDFELSAVLRSAFPLDTVHEVWLADGWRRDNDGWQIDARAVSDFARLLQEIPDCARIYFLGGLQDEADLDLATLEAAQERGLLPLFRLGQALAAHPLAVAHPLLVVVTNDSETIGTDIPRLPHGAVCRGLAKVMGRENLGLAVTCLDLSLADLSPENLEVRANLGQRLAAEPGATPFATVAWRGDQRYQPQLIQQTLPKSIILPFQVGGAYLIVGGAGGLGLTVARHLASHYQARLTLVGRRPVDPEIQTRLDELHALGGDAIYLQGDIADLPAMQTICREIHARWGRIHGAIHAAAVLHDGLLARLSEADFKSVLEPKLQGTAALALALGEDEPPDWLALFSSTASLTANPGQGNYTAASVGQDAIGLALPTVLNCPAYVINWGYWGEVGVAANATIQRLAATQGIGAIQADEGLAALERILSGDSGQIAVLKAASDVLARMTGTEHRVFPPSSTETPSSLVGAGGGGGTLFREQIRAALREVLKLDEEDLDDHTPFEQYGVDSLIAIGVLQCLERQTGPLPKTLLFECQTIAEVVAWLQKRAAPVSNVAPQPPQPTSAASILAIRASGNRPASFWVHSVVGEIAWVARLAEALGEDWPVYGFPARVVNESSHAFATLEAMATAYVIAIRQTQLHGPYLLGGYSFGGAVAFEMARQLLNQGEKIQGLLLLDAYAPGGQAMHALHDLSSDVFMVQAVANLLILQWKGSVLLKPEDLPGDRMAQIAAAARHLRAVCPTVPHQSAELEALLHRQLRLMQHHAELLEVYQPQPCRDPDLPVLLIRSTRGFVGADNNLALQPVQLAAGEEEDYGWSRWLAQPPHLVRVDADHFSLGLEPAIGEVARQIVAWSNHRGAARSLSLSMEPMEGNHLEERVFEVVKRHVLDILPHLSSDTITLDASLRELGANSLDRAEVAVCSMEALGINVPRRELAAVTNLRQLVTVLCAHYPQAETGVV